MNPTRNKVVVLGAGLAGLSAAWLLAKQGYQVELVEQESYAGGLAITRSDGEYKWDLGPHNIHTNYPHIQKFLDKTFPQMFEHGLPSLIYKNGRFLSYPLKGLKVIVSLPPLRLLAACFTLFVARLKMFLGEPTKDNNFESWIINRFGKILFQEYFRDYPRKVWGIEPNQIDKYVCEKRVPVISLVELFRSLILGRQSRTDHPEWATKHYYLPEGIGEMPDFFIKELNELGVKFHFSCRPQYIKSESDKVSSIVIVDSKCQEQELTADYLLSTIPINVLIKLFTDRSELAISAAASLDYVSSLLLFIKVRRSECLPAKLLYFSEPKLLFSRVSDVGGFSRLMVPESHNMICVEFPCSYEDKVWNMEESALAKHAIEALTERRIIKEEEVVGYFTEKVSHSYPRFREGFKENLTKCFDYINSFKNCLSYGRQGGFAYVNTDAVINLGFQAAESVIMSNASELSPSEWFYSSKPHS